MQARTFESDEARLASFGRAIDAIKHDVESRVGADDLRYVERLRLFSRAMEIVGRACIHVSFEPILFSIGVVALFLHKQVEATEIGHTALHGAYDRFGDKTGFHSSTFRWRVPIDEESWKQGHNVKHHGHTNVAGKDPDIHFGPVRLTTHTPWRPFHRLQLAFALLHIFPNFGFLMNLHFTGLNDVWFGNGRGGMDVLPDRSKAQIRRAYWRTIRKYAPYYAYEYLLFPALAGPMFWKVLLGNWLSETMRDVYSAATIFCGHVGEHVKAYPEGDRAAGRGAWYARQVEATNDFEVSWPVSVLCGGLDRQIEHHLFPKLAPQRLREVAPSVKKACEEHGVAYHTGSWGSVLRKALSWIGALSREAPTTTEVVRSTLRTMT
jgi:linoleoyl-CoA desaturase